MSRLTLEQLLSGEVPVSLINQPLDFVVDHELKAESALERARRRWRMPEPERKP